MALSCEGTTFENQLRMSTSGEGPRNAPPPAVAAGDGPPTGRTCPDGAEGSTEALDDGGADTVLLLRLSEKAILGLRLSLFV